MGFWLQKIPSPDSQTAQDGLEQTAMIFQDVRKMQDASLYQIQSVLW